MLVLSMEFSWNVTLSHLVRRANHVDFACDTFKYPSINDITRVDLGLV